MKNYVKSGDVLTLTPAVAVFAGVGYQFGAALFGVAINDVAANAPGEFMISGCFEIAKTSALAVSVGDRLFWDATNKVVNKTATSQLCVGVAVGAAVNPSGTVLIRLGATTPSGT